MKWALTMRERERERDCYVLARGQPSARGSAAAENRWGKANGRNGRQAQADTSVTSTYFFNVYWLVPSAKFFLGRKVLVFLLDEL